MQHCFLLCRKSRDFWGPRWASQSQIAKIAAISVRKVTILPTPSVSSELPALADSHAAGCQLQELLREANPHHRQANPSKQASKQGKKGLQ